MSYLLKQLLGKNRRQALRKAPFGDQPSRRWKFYR